MAKRNRQIRLTLANGDTRVVESKTTTEDYMRKFIADIEWRLPAKVVKWEVL